MRILKISVPEWVDGAAIQAHVSTFIEDQKREHQRVCALNEILESDESFDKWIRDEFGEHMGYGKRNTAAIDRAGTYSSVDRKQEICTREIWRGEIKGDDARRPVFMRGAKSYLIEKYSHTKPDIANGWCERVIRRYIRMKRLTAFTGAEYNDQMRDFYIAIHKKHYLSRTFESHKNRSFAPCECSGYRWVAGELHHRDCEKGIDLLLDGEIVHIGESQINELAKSLDDAKRRSLARAKRNMRRTAQRYWSAVGAPQRDISAVVAQRVLAELGSSCTQREAIKAIRGLLSKNAKEMINA